MEISNFIGLRVCYWQSWFREAIKRSKAPRNIRKYNMNLHSLKLVLENAVTAGAIPGAVVAATDLNGTIFEFAVGRQNMNDPQPMQVDSVFWVASMTKALTSVAALQMVEAGKLNLDTPISEVLPDLAAPQVLEGFDAEGKPRLRPANGPITLRQLLSHTAGFSYEFSNPDLARFLKETKTPSAATGLLAGLRQPLMSDPGARWEYGINTDWVGRAVETVSGLKL
ncbi:MAG TPA: serine hydrolase domain-containing protein, partial [Acidocella sp.]|nr:serine hydrolase domain-containing protein [Acidocella sp.]